MYFTVLWGESVPINKFELPGTGALRWSDEVPWWLDAHKAEFGFPIATLIVIQVGLYNMCKGANILISIT